MRFKPACSATKTREINEISLVASLDTCIILSNKQITKVLIRLRRCAGWSAPLLFATPEDRFSRVEAQIEMLGLYPQMTIKIHAMS